MPEIGGGLGMLRGGMGKEEQPSYEQDPWKHRSMSMRCGTCMFFVPKVSDVPRNVALGRCRRHAPTMSGYPVVFSHDWCGDHKLDENKT